MSDFARQLVEAAVDWPGYLRYGMPTSEKEAIAIRGELPGAPADRTEDQRFRQRHAAGYLHAQQWPSVSKVSQPIVDAIHALLGDDPEVHEWARRGAQDARDVARYEASAPEDRPLRW